MLLVLVELTPSTRKTSNMERRVPLHVKFTYSLILSAHSGYLPRIVTRHKEVLEAILFPVPRSSPTTVPLHAARFTSNLE